MATSSIATNAYTGSNAASTAATSATSATSADVSAKVQKALAVANPGIAKLNATLTRDQTKLSALGQLQSALANFQSLASSLSGSGLSTSASSTPPGVLSATSSAAAKAGNYALEIQQLAQGQFLTSASFSAADSKLGTGASTSVKIEFGTDANPGFSPVGASKTLTIDASNNTPDGIAAALKAAGIDAKVVKGEQGYALTIAGQTGAAHSLRISVSGDPAIKNLLAYDPDGVQKMSQSTAAQDARLTLDGKPVTSASNTLEQAVTGLTLKLTTTGKTSVSVTQDPTQVSKNVQAFVTAYNDLNKKMQALQQGDLKADTALKQVSGGLAQLLKTGGVGVSPAALATAGVSLDASGNLKLDDKKLQAALSTDAGAVGKLFTNGGKGIVDQLAAKAGAYTTSSSVVGHEASALMKEMSSVNAKRSQLAQTLTTQASALAALYTQQAQSGSGGSLYGSGATSLFDMLA
ncbi:MAG: flagellar filament capping protein FliD [Sphingomonadaceae bacterium]